MPNPFAPQVGPIPTPQQKTINLAQPTAQSATPDPLEELVRTLAAKGMKTDQDRWQQLSQGGFRQSDKGKAALIGGLSGFMANRQGKRAEEEELAAAKAQQAQQAQQAKKKATAIYQAYVANGFTPDQAQAAADMSLAGMDVGLPKQAAPKDLDTEVITTYVDGKPVQQLINKQTGQVIQDLGAGKPTEGQGSQYVTIDQVDDAGNISKARVQVQPGQSIPTGRKTPEAIKEEEKQRKLQNARAVFQRYYDLIGEQGYEPDVPFNRAQGKQMKAAHTAAQLAAKEVFELGALQGPDIELLAGAIPDADSLMGAATDWFSGGKQGMLNALQEGLNVIDRQLGGSAPQEETEEEGPTVIRYDSNLNRVN